MSSAPARPQEAITFNSKILVTGAAGFIGARVVNSLLARGYRNLRCFVRPSSDTRALDAILESFGLPLSCRITGNLLSRDDCAIAARGVEVVYHLVTGRGKSFPGCFQNSVVTTRNVLDAIVAEGTLRMFVNVSSFAVHSNTHLKRGAVFDETCPLEDNLEERFDAYVYAKLKQEELVEEYHNQSGIPYVNVRPGVVIGPGKHAIPGAVGLDSFGFFLHLGGGNRLPLTYVDNCAEAIVLAGVTPGVAGNAYLVFDDDLPTSRGFLRSYKEKVRCFRSYPVPYPLFYLFCRLWEQYARNSRGQLPPVFNRRFCSFFWKGHRYSNSRIKQDLGWAPKISMADALERYFTYQKNGAPSHA